MKNRMISRMMAVVCASALVFAMGCGGQTQESADSSADTVQESADVAQETGDEAESADVAQPEAESADSTENEEPTTYRAAIEQYLVEELSTYYESGEVSIPSVVEVDADESNPDDVLVWGIFYIYNYNIDGDTLVMVSGGTFPGLFHLENVDGVYSVTDFEVTEDGSDFDESAKEIFGDRYDAAMEALSADDNNEEIRRQMIAEYVEKLGLSVTQYQDYEEQTPMSIQ